jgi:nitroreductase
MCATTASSAWEVLPSHFPAMFPRQEQLKFLLQYAILAPSSKNTQPWRFSIGENTIGLFADLTRWQTVADASRRELYISLGCALENLLVAAEQFGFRHEVHYFPHRGTEELAATIAVSPGGTPSVHRTVITLDTITNRHTRHGSYSNRPVTTESRGRLLRCCGDLPVRIDLTDDPTVRSRVVELNLHADEMEFADPAYRKELGHWVGQGVFGTPPLLSRLGELVLNRVNVGGMIGKRNAAVLSSAPLVGLISAPADDRISQVRTGQALERVWLHATAMGIALQPMSQTLEIPSLRGELTRLIPETGWIPQQMFRIGYPPRHALQHTPRRLVDDVMLG